MTVRKKHLFTFSAEAEGSNQLPEGAPPEDADIDSGANTDDSANSEEQPVGLGDAGKKAIDAMKAERNQAREDAKRLQAEIAQLKAKEEGREAEYQAELDRQKVNDEALAKANTRIVKAEVRALAAGKLADPNDALQFLDLSSIEVSEDGAIDAAVVEQLITDLLTSKPYLAAQSGKRFEGEADGGPRNVGKQARQLTLTDLESMTPEQVNQARKDGLMDRLIGANK
jgi:hypothetical protein